MGKRKSAGTTTELPGEYKVRVIFKGFIITNIVGGASEAMIGALAPVISSCHQPKIYVCKLFPSEGLPGGPGDGRIEVLNPILDLGEDFSVKVDPAPSGAIKRYEKDAKPFDRSNEKDNDRQDFRWFGNLAEMHDLPKVDVDLGFLHPKFTMNAGVFYTHARSDGEATITTPNKPDRPFHRFGIEIAARVPLETGSKATFYNGTRVVKGVKANGSEEEITVKSDDRFRYDIIYDCHCDILDDATDSDFGIVYPKIIKITDPKKQIKILRTGKRLFNPEVYCVGGNFP